MLLKWEVKQNSSGVLNCKSLFQIARFCEETVFEGVGSEAIFAALSTETGVKLLRNSRIRISFFLQFRDFELIQNIER